MVQWYKLITLFYILPIIRMSLLCRRIYNAADYCRKIKTRYNEHWWCKLKNLIKILVPINIHNHYWALFVADTHSAYSLDPLFKSGFEYLVTWKGFQLLSNPKNGIPYFINCKFTHDNCIEVSWLKYHNFDCDPLILLYILKIFILI